MYTSQLNNFQENTLENSNQILQSQENESPIKSYTDQIISSFKTCNRIKVHESQINGLNISSDGNLILTSSKDDSITIYSIQRNEISSHYNNKTHGCEKAIFTHDSNAILCASKNDYRIMYWLLHNNEILFSFQGHSDVITELNLNPNNDLFISTSLDKIVFFKKVIVLILIIVVILLLVLLVYIIKIMIFMKILLIYIMLMIF